MRIPTVLNNMALDEYPETEKILAAAKQYCPNGQVLDASAVARKLGNIQMTNVIMLGALAKAVPFFDYSEVKWLVNANSPTRFKEANVQEGDVVAVGVSGSFPALNISTYAALESLGVRPLVISTRTRRATMCMATAALEDGPPDLPLFDALDDIADLHVVEAVEHDATLEALLDLRDVLLQVAHGGDPALPYGIALPPYPSHCAANHVAVQDVASRDGAEARGLEERPDFRLPDHNLFALHLEHAEHGVADIVEQVVDDLVQADLDVFV
jgi:hypothetical protein